MTDIERWSPLRSWLYTLFNGSPKSNTAVVNFARLSAEDRFLDIGCGPGAALEDAAKTGATVSGVDPSPSMVQRAQNRAPDADVKVGSAEEIPFADDSFTVVINILSFHHWADREAGLKEALRVLAPGGKLHVAEGKLRDNSEGHGLSPQDAEILSIKLTELGYEQPRVDEIRLSRRRRFLVVTGSAPTS